MKIDRREPAGAAIPIGSKVLGNFIEARYVPGILVVTIEIALCANVAIEIPRALKYPLKQK